MTKENLVVIDNLLPEAIDFSAAHILCLLRNKQRKGLLDGLEIGKNAPACLAGVLQGFTEGIICDAIACAVEAKSNSVDLRHLQTFRFDQGQAAQNRLFNNI